MEQPTAASPVYSRILKLLALADSARNSSEAEAQAAALKVQDMLADYGLTLAQVEAAGGTGDASSARSVEVSDRRALYLWQRQLMAALAENNFCLHRVTVVDAADGRKQRASRRHQLVGRRLNVDATLNVYDYLAVAVRRAAEAAGYDHARAEKDHHRFLDGAVTRLIERLAERRRQREAESEAARAAQPVAGNGSGTELVLSDVYGTEADLNNDALNGFPAGTTASRRREREAKTARQQAEHDRLVAEGTDWAEAFYLSHGYDAATATRYADSYNRTSKSRSRRGGGRGRTRNWTAGNEAHYAKVNSASYRAGKEAGGNIGLDDQVGQSRTRRIK